MREQLQSRTRALEVRKNDPSVTTLVAESRDAIGRADAIEERLHNPRAEVVYDILAMRGGTRLYSRLAPMQMWAAESQGPPTSGMTQVIDAQEKELAQLEADVRAFLAQEVASLNARAAKLGLSFVIVQ